MRGHDGTVSIVQPLIAPLYNGRSAHEVMSAFSEGGVALRLRRRALVLDGERRRRYDERTAPTPPVQPATASFDRNWRKWLHDGIVPNTAFPVEDRHRCRPRLPAATAAPAGSGDLEVVFRPDPSVYDGRFANNAWLQELPKSLTKLTWDNAALIAPQTADRLMLVERRPRRTEAG